MKKNYLKFIVAMLLLISTSLTAQEKKDSLEKTEEKAPPSDGTQTFTPPFQIGLGVGFNNAPHPRHEYYISATNGTLQRDAISKASFVGSVVVAYAIPWKYTYVYKNGKAIGDKHAVPGPISILSSFNLTELNSSMSFNTALNGGLGLGFNIQNVMHIGVFCDFTRGRFLRDAYADSLGKQIMVGTTPLTSLDQADNRFFKDGIITSYSFKVIFIINRRTTDIKPTTIEDNINDAVGKRNEEEIPVEKPKK